MHCKGIPMKSITTKILGATLALGLALPAMAAPSINKGDTAWMFIATILVIMMSIPGLALFYGGLVRAKNMLSVLLQIFMIFSLIIVLWCLYGYSLTFTSGSPFIGGFDRAFLN
jgi:Amt family ammonium transporter